MVINVVPSTGCKIFFAERGKLPLMFTCLAGTSTTLFLIKVSCTLPKTSLAERGKLGSLSACPIYVFLPNLLATCEGESAYVAHCSI